MGLGRYDKYFGGQRGAAERTLESMRRTYGAKDGEHVFRAMIAKRKRRSIRPPRGKR
jgi:hypothetical protein